MHMAEKPIAPAISARRVKKNNCDNR